MDMALPFNLRGWIEINRESLKPPVCNRELYVGSEFIVMIVGGPNARKDYHYDVGPELFHQIEGDMLLKTMQDGRPVDIRIREGDIFLLPPGVPHSPQRFANTVGLVVERQRKADELDGFMWYCEECHTKLYEEFLPVADIVSDLPPIFERFWADSAARTCKNCGAVLNRD
jgi:3-hydroxyanthranilate 3,4-dioxygenase